MSQDMRPHSKCHPVLRVPRIRHLEWSHNEKCQPCFIKALLLLSLAACRTEKINVPRFRPPTRTIICQSSPSGYVRKRAPAVPRCVERAKLSLLVGVPLPLRTAFQQLQMTRARPSTQLRALRDVGMFPHAYANKLTRRPLSTCCSGTCRVPIARDVLLDKRHPIVRRGRVRRLSLPAPRHIEPVARTLCQQWLLGPVQKKRGNTTWVTH